LLNRAGSWEEFTSSLRTWASPPLSFLYADVEGNIGFFPAGEIPVRTAHDGTLPVDGATDAYEWQGSIPHELKPMMFNPEGGILVSANHSMLPPEAPYPLGADTLASYRANRIRELLRTIPVARRLRANPGGPIRRLDGGGSAHRRRSQAPGG
jgi:penicillin amidase